MTPAKKSPPLDPRVGMRRLVALAVLGGSLVLVVLGYCWFQTPYSSLRGWRYWQRPDRAAPVSRRDSPTLSAEIRDVAVAWHYFRINPFFVGEIVNTGTEAIALPGATITLVYPNGDTGGSEFCWTKIPRIEPGERAGCFVGFWYKYSEERDLRARAELLPLVPTKAPRPKLTVLDVRLEPARGDENPWVYGYVRNDSDRHLTAVWAQVLLYGRDSRVVGVYSTVVATEWDGGLGPGAIGELLVDVHTVASEPVTVTVLPSAEPDP